MKLEINKIKKIGKFTNMWKLSNLFLNNHCITEEKWKEMRKYLEVNKNKKKACQDLWNATKAIPRGKFITINTYVEEKRKIPNNELNSTP